MANGLDEVHPFSDTIGVDVLLRQANQILSSDVAMSNRRNAARIWAFIFKFTMLDRFCKTLGVAERFSGIRIPRKTCSPEYLGTSSKVRTLLYYDFIWLSQLLVFIPS